MADLNVADSVGAPQLPPLVRWSLLISSGALVLVMLMAVGLSAIPGARQQIESALSGAPDIGPAAPSPTGEPSQHVPVVDAGTPTGRPPPAATSKPAPTLRARAAAPVWQIGRLTSPPQMDGDLDDWHSEPIEIIEVVFGGQFWDGPADLSARAFGSWSDQALFLGVRVVDDVFSQPARGTELYLGDSLEVQLDADLEGDWDAAEYNGDDWQIGLSPGDFAGQGPEVHIWRPPDRTAAGIELSARRLDDGYILEVSIPWSLVEIDPTRVRSIGLALNVSDNDVADPAQLTMISSSPTRSWADPRTFGTLVLAAQD